ncbi:hypothetical protein EXIGLDRAFT_843783 [Exidia glandulosa HHB12029]|uniref:BTB domain-containing protein n=1 Tax=Exidia glandulosa HHB12029 TaxID=1314781 RepID=A0A165ZG33_EXIGL|nr:hypothetical protein EXIGLDRAFT_843783 [Exidia glandulosa HHB12029]
MLDKYTVTLRGEAFTLYRDQIEFDAPNYFSNLFLGDFSESQTRTVELSRSPELFRAIVDYMSGYTILPLTPAVVPATMASDSALENLLRDAEFYGLRGLVALLQPQVTASKTVFFNACQAFALADQVVDLSDLLRGGELADGILCDERGVGCVREGTWHPVPIKASGMVIEDNSDGWVTLTEPLLHEKLGSAFRDRGTLVPTRSCDLDGHTLQGIQARILPSAPIIVEGIETGGKSFVGAMAQASNYAWRNPTTSVDDLTGALMRILKNGGLAFVAEDIFFTIRLKAADMWCDSSIKVCILAARLISRTAAARRML